MEIGCEVGEARVGIDVGVERRNNGDAEMVLECVEECRWKRRWRWRWMLVLEVEKVNGFLGLFVCVRLTV